MARKYKWLIQAGHVAPREPGFESGTGTAGEQEFTAAITARLAALLRKDGRFDVETAPGDLPDGKVVDGVIYEHCDGSANKDAAGFSFGWDVNSPAGGPKLAAAIGARYLKLGHPGGHHTDNYTGGLRFYYGYRRIIAYHEVLVENGFLSNPEEAAWMRDHIGELAEAQYLAILDVLGLPPGRSTLSPAKLLKRERLHLWIKSGATGRVTHSRSGWKRNVGALRAIARDKDIHPKTMIFLKWQGHTFTTNEAFADKPGHTFVGPRISDVARAILTRYDH